MIKKNKTQSKLLSLIIALFIVVAMVVVSCQLPFFGGGGSDTPIIPPITPPPNNTPKYKIAYSNINTDLFIINEDGTNKQVISNDGYPTWSPDGTKLLLRKAAALYIYDFQTNQQIEIARYNGRGFRVFSDLNQFVSNTKIFSVLTSPPNDTDGIIYEVDITDINNVVLRRKGQAQNTTDILGPQLAVSRDGTKLAYSYTQGNNPDSYIIIQDLTTNQQTIITQTQGNQRSEELPKWSPNNDKILFRTLDYNNNYKEEIYLYDLNTNQLINLTNEFQLSGLAVATYDFSPDGTKIIFTYSRARYIYDIVNNQRTNIDSMAGTTGKSLFDPKWSNDGSIIFFTGSGGNFGGSLNDSTIEKIKVVGGNYIYDGLVVLESDIQEEWEVSPVRLP